VGHTPKGHERRDVPIPRFLVDEVSAHVTTKSAGELVFTGVKGGALRAQVFQRAVLSDAASSLGVPGLHPHELRKMDPDCAAARTDGADVDRGIWWVYGGAPWLAHRGWALARGCCANARSCS
jgi:hypothetical protein